MKIMQLQSTESIMNLGDTSFRREKLLDDYRLMLPILKETLERTVDWSPTNDSQSLFYQAVVKSGLVLSDFLNDYYLIKNNEYTKELKEAYKRKVESRFKTKYNGDVPKKDLIKYFIDEQKKRGRTYSNALAKIGLTDKVRQVTEVGNTFLNRDLQEDVFEELLQLDKDNLLFLRQLLKLRVYAPNGENYYYPFRVAVYMLSQFDHVPSSDLTILINTIRPHHSNEKILEVINNYEEVINNNKTFGEYLSENFRERNRIINLPSFYEEGVTDFEEFSAVFENRKTPSSIRMYYNLYLAILDFNKEPTDEKVKKLYQIGRDTAIKKAFGFNKVLFKYRLNDNWKEFKINNEELGLFVPDKRIVRRNFYSLFSKSKQYDLNREYSDMTERTFKLSGLISFENGLAKLAQSWVTLNVFGLDKLKDSFSSKGGMEEYEGFINSEFYINQSTLKILNVTEFEFEKIVRTIKEENNLSEEVDLSIYFKDKYYQNFMTTINNRFSNKDIIYILSLFQDRSNDFKISKKVTDTATIPTIFEYMLAIAWHRIANQTYNLKNSMKLSLDADYYPLSHAPGGTGDIVVKHDDYILMLEATLMDKHAQRRGELEPVIRHATNLTAVEEDKEVFTIFVADELDNNVINIFRATSFIHLESTVQRESNVKGVNIFALSITDVINLLENGVTDKVILETIEKHYEREPHVIESGWRKPILRELEAYYN